MINQYKSKDNTLYDIHDKRLPENLDAGKVVKVNSAGTGFEYGEAGGGQWTLLWTNASPSSSFSDQILNINSSGYSKIAIVSANSDVCIADKVSASGTNTRPRLYRVDSEVGTDIVIYSRYITTITDTMFQFSNNRTSFIETVDGVVRLRRVTQNNYLIPYRIYGFN